MSASIRGRLVGGALGPILAIAAPAALAQQPVTCDSVSDWTTLYTGWGHVTALETGPHDDTMSITLDPSVPGASSRSCPVLHQRPIFCKNENAGYALDPKDPGVKAHEAVLLAAYIAGKKVRLLINACVFDKPRVIAVGITD
jgi:hypothetical protein